MAFERTSLPALRGPLRVVAYDRNGGATTAAVQVGREGLDRASLLTAVRAIVPARAPAYAVYDATGTRIGLAIAPPEPLTDDPDTTACAMDAEGSRVLTGSVTGDLRLWDVASGDPLWSRAPADEPIAGVAFIDRRGWVLAWSDDGPLLVVSHDSGELVARVEDPQLGAFDVAVAPDGSEVALTGMRGVRIALPGGELLPALDAALAEGASRAHEADVAADAAGADDLDLGLLWLAYAHDGRTLVGLRAAESQDELVFWDRTTGERITTLPFEHGVAAADLSPDGRTVALGIASDVAAIVLVDATTRTVLRTVATGSDALHDVRFAPDGRTLFAHVAGAGLLAIDPTTGETRVRIAEDATRDLVIAVEGAVQADEDEQPGMMVTRNGAGGLELTVVAPRVRTGPIGRTSTRDGGRYALVTVDADNDHVALCDVATGHGLATLAHRGDVQEIWISSDGSRVAVRAAGHVTVWHVPDVPARIELARPGG